MGVMLTDEMDDTVVMNTINALILQVERLEAILKERSHVSVSKDQEERICELERVIGDIMEEHQKKEAQNKQKIASQEEVIAKINAELAYTHALRKVQYGTNGTSVQGIPGQPYPIATQGTATGITFGGIGGVTMSNADYARQQMEKMNVEIKPESSIAKLLANWTKA